MPIQRVMGTTPNFKGNKEMDALSAKYGRTSDDKKLVDLAKTAYAIQLDITGDGVYIDRKEEKEANDFFQAAKESKNGKLAFFLLNDCLKPFSLLDKLVADARSTMVEVARKSDEVTKEDVLNYLV